MTGPTDSDAYTCNGCGNNYARAEVEKVGYGYKCPECGSKEISPTWVTE